MNWILTFCLVLVGVSDILCCSPGWIQHGAYCYLFSHNAVTWAEAEVRFILRPVYTLICKTFEGTLAEPVDVGTDNFIIQQTLKTGRKYWLGITDLEQEGTFRWASTRIPLSTYTNWIQGDPNNANAGEDCVLNNWNRDGKWADGDCEWKEYYICQAENVGSEIIG